MSLLPDKSQDWSGKIKKRSSGRFFYAVGKKIKRFTYLLKGTFRAV